MVILHRKQLITKHIQKNFPSMKRKKALIKTKYINLFCRYKHQSLSVPSPKLNYTLNKRP